MEDPSAGLEVGWEWTTGRDASRTAQQVRDPVEVEQQLLRQHVLHHIGDLLSLRRLLLGLRRRLLRLLPRLPGRMHGIGGSPCCNSTRCALQSGVW